MEPEELIGIKPQIENTMSIDSLGVGEREFAWMYEPEKPLKRLRDIKTLRLFLAGGPKNAVNYETPVNTNATALVHNHISNNMCPSDDDIKEFLRIIPYNHGLMYDVIAGTKGGKVGGFSVMTYFGERDEALSLKNSVERVLNNYCVTRQRKIQREIKKNPELSSVLWGEDIFSVDEKMRISEVLMQVGKIYTELFTVSGYTSRRWRIVEEGK